MKISSGKDGNSSGVQYNDDIKYGKLASQDLEGVLASVRKAYGKSSIMGLNDSLAHDVEVISTGSIKVDEALGIGGLPKGRVIEIMGMEGGGKTTLALSVITAAQKAGGTVAFIDAEHALDASLAKSVGVDTDHLLISQPDYGEQALDILHMLVASNKFDVIVVDSVAALVPKAELEGEMEDANMGAQARMMGKGLRKISGVTAKSKTMVIFINQIRQKLGITFGCFHEDTPVIFADGTQHRIKDVVEKKMEGPVLSFDEKKQQFIPKKIKGWNYNGLKEKTTPWYMVDVSSSGGPNGMISFTSTPNHQVYVEKDGKIVCTSTSELRVGDKMVSFYEKDILLRPKTVQFIEGCLLGDGTIRMEKEGTAVFHLINNEQREYLDWKLDKLSEMKFRKYVAHFDRKDSYYYSTEHRTEYTYLRKAFYREGYRYKGCPLDLVLTPLSLAVWYMDDGHYRETHRNAMISIKRLFTEKRHDEINRMLSEIRRLISCDETQVYTDKQNHNIKLPTEAFKKMSKLIRSYVPECMQYKLVPEDRGFYKDFSLEKTVKPEIHPFFVTVKKITLGSKRKSRSSHKYDLTVDGNANYLVGGSFRGVLVHNSNEVTPGGKALKFFASVRIDIRAISKIKNGENVIGNRVKVNIVKNKLAPPCKVIETDLYFGKGFLKESELIDVALGLGIIKKSSSWLVYNGENIAQGKLSAVSKLQEKPELFEEILSKISERGIKCMEIDPVDVEESEENND